MSKSRNVLRAVLAIGIIAGFFLPWFDYMGSVSGWDLVRIASPSDTNTQKAIQYSFLLPAFFALIVLIRSLTGRSTGFFLRALPFLVTALLSVLFVYGLRHEEGKEALKGFFSVLGSGYYLTVLTSFVLMLIGR